MSRPGQFDYSITIAGAQASGRPSTSAGPQSTRATWNSATAYMRSAAQNWGSIVNAVTREAQVRFP
jgi:hypothetical protein